MRVRDVWRGFDIYISLDFRYKRNAKKQSWVLAQVEAMTEARLSVRIR
jgi:hypothetical protein